MGAPPVMLSYSHSTAEVQTLTKKNWNDGEAGSILTGLKDCSRSRNPKRGKEIHSQAAQAGLVSNKYVANILINMYAKCRMMLQAHTVLDSMVKRDAVSWNTLLQGYVEQGEYVLALEIFHDMDVEPDARSFVNGLAACANLSGQGETRWLAQGREIHSRAVSSFCCDSFVETMLVKMYARSGCMVDARHVFDGITRRDVVSWTSLLRGYADNGELELALELFEEMQGVCVADSRTFVAVLKACSGLARRKGRDEDSSKWLATAKKIHSLAVKNRCCDIFVETVLIETFASCGSMLDARGVFENMPRRDEVCWTVLIQGYVENVQSETAMLLFEYMEQNGLVSDPRTYVAALGACTGLAAKGNREKWLKKGRGIHTKAEACQNVFVECSLVDMYSKLGSMADARMVFDRMAKRNVVCWNALLQGYVDNDQSELALEMFERMEKQTPGDCSPNERSYAAALAACASLASGDNSRWLLKGRALHARAVRSLFCDDIYVKNMLINMYAHFRRMVHSRCMFDSVAQPNVVSWNCLLQGYVDCGENRQALELLACMDTEMVLKNSATFVAALMACGNLADVESGEAFRDEIQELGLEKDPVMATCIVDFYGKCGRMEAAKEIFDSISNKSAVTWNSLIGGYSLQGDTRTVFELFASMERSGIVPNGATFVCILVACSHAGLTDKVMEYFELIKVKYGISPTLQHYACMVDLLGRANRIEEALDIVQSMPFKADAAIWSTLLGACRKWSNMTVAKLAFGSLLELDKSNSLAYVLMANIFGGTHEWEEEEVLADKQILIRS